MDGLRRYAATSPSIQPKSTHRKKIVGHGKKKPVTAFGIPVGDGQCGLTGFGRSPLPDQDFRLPIRLLKNAICYIALHPSSLQRTGSRLVPQDLRPLHLIVFEQPVRNAFFQPAAISPFLQTADPLVMFSKHHKLGSTRAFRWALMAFSSNLLD